MDGRPIWKEQKVVEVIYQTMSNGRVYDLLNTLVTSVWNMLHCVTADSWAWSRSWPLLPTASWSTLILPIVDCKSSPRLLVPKEWQHCRATPCNILNTCLLPPVHVEGQVEQLIIQRVFVSLTDIFTGRSNRLRRPEKRLTAYCALSSVSYSAKPYPLCFWLSRSRGMYKSIIGPACTITSYKILSFTRSSKLPGGQIISLY